VFSAGTADIFNPEQTKDFPEESIQSQNPEIGRIALIF
jgi:hypothetical protein